MTEILSNGKLIDKELKETFGDIEVYEFDRFTDDRRCGTREVYKVSDKRDIAHSEKVLNLEVGIFPTERFYFLFPWKECMVNNSLEFNKLTGLMEVAHGQRAKDSNGYLNYDPFEPPKGNWQIHWVGPHGSVAVGKTDAKTLTSRIFGSSIIDGQNNEHYYYGQGLIKRNKTGCQAQSGKYTDPLKYASGTISTRHKIMNYRLDKFATGEDFDEHFNEGVGLVQCSSKIGMVITRNREIKSTSLEELLKSIKKWGFPTNLVFSSCRFIEPEKIWNEKNNEGPIAILPLKGQVSLPVKASSGKAIGKKVFL